MDNEVTVSMGLINQLAYGYEYYSVITLSEKPAHLRDYNGFVPSIAPTSYREERDSFVSTPLHYHRGVGVNASGEVLHNNEFQMCAMCRCEFAHHSEDCTRNPDSEFGDHPFDYYQYRGTNHVVPYEDYSGYGGVEITREDEWDSFAESRDFDTEDFYWDDNGRECTSAGPVRLNSVAASNKKARAKEQALLKSMQVDTSAYEPQQRTVYVEGIDGFSARKLVDFQLSAKADAKILNVYQKDGILRIGGMQLFPTRTVDNVTGEIWTRIVARCGNRECAWKPDGVNWKQAEFFIEGFYISREQMEDFVYSLIRHGNNHCADWFHTRTIGTTSRKTLESTTFRKIGTRWAEDEDGFYEVGVYDKKPVYTKQYISREVVIQKEHKTYYKVHTPDCKLDCDPKSVTCKPVLQATAA